MVDDDPDDLWLLRRALTKAASGDHRIELEVLKGSAAALEWLMRLEQTAGKSSHGAGIPDLMLIDMGMPGLSGIELLRLIRARPAFAQTAVLMITTAAEPHLSEEARQAGAADILAKPDTLAGLDALARRLVALPRAAARETRVEQLSA